MKKILVADDQLEIRTLIMVTLRGSGHETFAATNGKEAVEIAASKLPDLVIMDVMMPEMDGFEATKIIKSAPETKDCKVLMLTAKGQEADKIKGNEAGADAYFTKPFSPLELLQKIDEILK